MITFILLLGSFLVGCEIEHSDTNTTPISLPSEGKYKVLIFSDSNPTDEIKEFKYLLDEYHQVETVYFSKTEKHDSYAEMLNINSFPTIVVLDSKGPILSTSNTSQALDLLEKE